MKRLLTSLLTLVLTLTLAAQKKSDKSTSMNLQWGIEALRNGEIEEGMALLEKVIADDPTNGYAYLWLALGRSTSDDVDAILTDVNNALKYLPKKDKKYKGTAYSVRAKVYLAQKDTVAALNDYTLAIKCAPDFKSLYEDRAQLYFELHQYELSNKDYDKLLELDPNSGLGFMGKGRNYRDLRRYDLAIKHFTYVLQTHPNYSKAYSFRAECLLMQNKYSEAADDILLALDIDEDDKARMLLIDEFNGDKMNVMKKKLERMKSKEPNRVLWCYYLALLQEVNELYKDAIRHYKEAKRIDPNVVVDERLAVCYACMGNFAKAVEHINPMIEIDSTRSTLYSRRAHYYSELGEVQKAIEDYDTYARFDPENSLAYFFLGWEKHMAGQYEEAIEDFTKGIAIDSTFSPILDGRARSYLALGQTELAKADFEKILSFDTVPGGNSCAAFAYHFLGQDSLAIDYALRCLEVDTDAYYNVACAYALAGDADKAVEYLRKAFEDGFVRFYHLTRDVDFDAIRQDPAFQALIKEYTEKIQQSWEE